MRTPLLLGYCLCLAAVGCGNGASTKPGGASAPELLTSTVQIKSPGEGVSLLPKAKINAEASIAIKSGGAEPTDLMLAFYRSEDDAVAGEFVAQRPVRSEGDNFVFAVEIVAPSKPGDYILVATTDPKFRPAKKGATKTEPIPPNVAIRKITITP